MDDGSQQYSFWLWQYEARSQKPNHLKTFKGKDFSHEGCPNNIIPPSEIIQSIIDDSFSPIGPSFVGLGYYGSSIEKLECYDAIPVTIDMMQKRHKKVPVAVNVNEDNERLLCDFMCFLTIYKYNEYMSTILRFPDNKDETVLKKLNDDMVEADERLNSLLLNKRKAVRKDGVSRALGLWLFDYCQEHACGCPTAEAALRDTGYLQQLSYDKEYRHFARLLANAKKCIEACEVLPISA
ncbi:MAG: hypothetical protein AAGU21_14175 [Solidesulfovibrio sp.]|uniref:hypothetical protein n=1 Tax=Solidesulfovibrio sp. TaxID=2910990 RepID=UPI002B20D532|nr:hypothetical protein [Solidesulfovibrio sp.]MEA4856103.1 hypothetical protein [Solidesulfovibrio sp.]